jgi:hypothetical protein
VIVSCAAALLGFLGIVVVPCAVQAIREYARRQTAVSQLAQIKLALENYEKWSDVPTAGAEATALPFETYSGYLVSSKLGPDVGESCMVITNEKRFNEVFWDMDKKGDTFHGLPDDAFASNLVLAVIRRPPPLFGWRFDAERVTEGNGIVQLRYAATSEKSDAVLSAYTLIVSIPKADKRGYKAVEFIENGKTVKTIAIGYGKRDRSD